MNKSNKYSPEVRARAVRLVQEHRSEYPSLWSTIESIAPKIGWSAHTLLEWVRKHETDTGLRDGVTSEERDRKLKSRDRSSTSTATPMGSSRSARFCRSAHQGIGDISRNSVIRLCAVPASCVMMNCCRRYSGSGRPTCRSMVPTRSGVSLSVKMSRWHAV
ncbi:hypothetical protein SAMN05216379_11858, partial [Nitrosomonas eutropha]